MTDRRAALAALALGAGVTWNISNVGAVADPLADAYGVPLTTIGLLTTALFATHLLVQLPAGRGSDVLGARRVGLLAVAAIVAGNLILLAAPSVGAALVGRALAGLGSGAGFVAGADLMRSAGGSPLLQGAYGGATMAGGGIAIAVVPQLEPWLGWRAPYVSALAAVLVTAVALALAPRVRATGRAAGRVRLLADRRLTRLAALNATSFGLAVAAANWVVPMLERQGHARSAAGALGALVLLAGVVTRPLGGLLVGRRAVLGAAVLVGAGAFAALSLPLPLAALGVAAALAGLAAGVPFASVFAGAQAARPDAPGAAVAYVNAWGITAIVAGTPLLGLTFSLPGDGRIGFACVAGLWLAALALLPRPGDARPGVAAGS